MVRSMVLQPTQKPDGYFSKEIQDHLFDFGEGGIDLIATNIQRGRDHGIQGDLFIH